ncbi:melanoma cell adhesion molecule b isoform X1 [Fundulus heteroclitus]|uniref:melanoma cell adhesion molecule b isoform X1 n=2 Tax=Fundulus heteroclitus TaxID=8078 RepID=UPI00165C7ACE|nr:melanoma cell adhesion molecule b isoform X1 [Fundulus heteroclitus]
MAVRDAASLLPPLLLLALLHTWGARAAVEVTMEEEVQVFHGDTARIPCTVTSDDGSGGMIVQWFYVISSGKSHLIYNQDSMEKRVVKNTPYTDRIAVENNGTAGGVLTISDVQLHDEVEFVCHVRSLTDGTGEGRTRLRVFKTPDFPTIERAEKGISVDDEPSKVGTCEVKNGYPKPTITWYRNNMPLRSITDVVNLINSATTGSSDLFSVKSELFLKVKKEDKDATFYCEVKYLVPGAEKMTETNGINITVFYPATEVNMWVESPKRLIVEGDSVKLRCSSNGNVPSQEFEIKDKNGVSLGGSEAVLEKVSRLDSGVYECSVVDMNTFEELTTNTAIFVNYLDEAVIEPKDTVLVEQRKELKATCNALSSLHTKTTWLKNGKEVSKGHYLSLKNITYDDAGLYVCIVTVPEIEEMQTNASLQVHVQGPPEITENKLIEKETAEKEVELSCHVKGYPTPKITWTSSDGKVIGSASHMTTELGAKSVVKVKVTSNMTVICSSSNSFGTDSVTYSIKAKITKHTTTPATTTTTTITSAYTTPNVSTNTSTTTNTAIPKSKVKAETAKPPEKVKKGSNGVIIAVIIICILLLAILGSVLYFLYKKGKICNRSGKQDFTKEKSGKDRIVVEMKSDNTEEAILLGVNGEKQLPGDQIHS